MKILSYFSPRLPFYLVYMLQQVENDPRKFLQWIARSPNLFKVMRRKKLVMTAKAKLLIIYCYCAALFYIGINIKASQDYALGELLYLLFTPIWVIFILFISVMIAWSLIELPRRKKEIKRAEKIFSKHKALKIAITGSYGKTTIKELLATILEPHKNIASTPGNMNVLISQARWANKLSGNEEVLLIEFGEGEPGDIIKMARLTHPDIAVINGVAPNHLDRYRTVEAVGKDLFSISSYVKNQYIYVNTSSPAVKKFLDKDNITYAQSGIDGWKIVNVSSDIEGVSFNMKKAGTSYHIKSQLLGRHQIGPLALCVVIAHNLGLSKSQIEAAVARTRPFEHRMQPRKLGGGWIIDDTYNGNLEGFLAGIKLLDELKAKKKIYVTPGLVDQAQETRRVHREIGAAIAKTDIKKVVLMKNSVTRYIEDGLVASGFRGQLEIVEDPLEFYTNMDQYIAAGDIWLLQNDWTDNYY